MGYGLCIGRGIERAHIYRDALARHGPAHTELSGTARRLRTAHLGMARHSRANSGTCRFGMARHGIDRLKKMRAEGPKRRVIVTSFDKTEFLRVHRNPTSSQKSYELTGILRAHRNPASSQESYEFTEILRAHRNPTSSQKSYEFTEILRVHRNPANSQTSY